MIPTRIIDKPVAEMKDAFFEAFESVQKQNKRLAEDLKKHKDAVEVAFAYLETLKVQTKDIKWPAQEAIDKMREKLS